MVITATHRAPHGTAHASIANYLGISLRRDRAGSMALVFPVAAE
jgi:hypothetical protein